MRNRPETVLPLSVSPRCFSRPSSGGTAGQSLVELALALPVFLLILVGTADFARFTWTTIEVSNAARAGAQYGAQSSITASDEPGISNAARQDGADLLSGLTVTPPTHTCSCSTAPTSTIQCATALTACPSPNIILEYVQVNTSATVTPLFHYPGVGSTFTARGQALMEVNRDLWNP